MLRPREILPDPVRSSAGWSFPELTVFRKTSAVSFFSFVENLACNRKDRETESATAWRLFPPVKRLR